jgi:hypothetical protein
MSLSSGDNPKAGQTSVTTTPGALAATQPCSAVLVQNDPGSANNVLIGDSAHQYVQLKPGQSVSIPCSNLSQVYVATAAGTATANWISVS